MKNEQLNPEELQTPQLATLQADSDELLPENLASDVDVELTDEEKREVFIRQLKDSKIKFNPIKNIKVKTTGVRKVVSQLGNVSFEKIKTIVTNETTNQFGTEFRKKRKIKNKQTKASRKANRK